MDQYGPFLFSKKYRRVLDRFERSSLELLLVCYHYTILTWYNSTLSLSHYKSVLFRVFTISRMPLERTRMPVFRFLKKSGTNLWVKFLKPNMAILMRYRGIVGKIKKEETYIKSPTNEFAMYQPPANPDINPIKQQVPTDTVIVYKLYPIIPPNRTPIIRNMLIHNNTNNKFFASFFINYSPSLGRYFYSVSSHYTTLVFRETPLTSKAYP